MALGAVFVDHAIASADLARYLAIKAGRCGLCFIGMRKDPGLVLAQARCNGAQLPVTTLIDGYYAEPQAVGKGRLDTSSLVERLRWPARRRCSTGMLIRRETPDCVSP